MARRKTPIWRRQRPSTKIKRKVAKFTGIPTTKSGRKAKIRRECMPGCVVSIAAVGSVAYLIAQMF